MTWLNEPRNWKQENDHLSVFADARTDFWRKTHYGFVRDNGHFYYERIAGNFEVETEFRGRYESLYDQAGLMVRLDETTWLKTGIEFVNGVHYLSAVVTRDYSDWSVVPLYSYPGSLRLRLKREGGAVTIEYSLSRPRVGDVPNRLSLNGPRTRGRTDGGGPGGRRIRSCLHRVSSAALKFLK